jgi:hypothetical protein
MATNDGRHSNGNSIPQIICNCEQCINWYNNVKNAQHAKIEIGLNIVLHACYTFLCKPECRYILFF